LQLQSQVNSLGLNLFISLTTGVLQGAETEHPSLFKIQSTSAYRDCEAHISGSQPNNSIH